MAHHSRRNLPGATVHGSRIVGEHRGDPDWQRHHHELLAAINFRKGVPKGGPSVKAYKLQRSSKLATYETPRFCVPYHHSPE